MGKPIVFVAQDIAPSGAFERVGGALREQDAEVCTFFGKGKPYTPDPEELRGAVRGAAVVVLGMSSSAKLAIFEIAAAEAARAAKAPYGFYLDTANCHERAWFGDLRDGASFFLVINDREKGKVAAAYPRAKVFATGNPFREGAFFPRFTREEVRSRLGVADGKVMVLAPGGKSPCVNIAVWSALLDGLEEVRNIEMGEVLPRSFRVFLSYHPGDRTPYAEDPDAKAKGKDSLLNIYGDLAQFAPKGVRVEVLPAAPDFKTSDALPGADLVAEFGSTIAIEAAAQRKPILTISTVVGRERLFAASGTETTEPVELELAWDGRADSGSNIADGIRDLLTEEGFAPFRKAQEVECPTPSERGAAVKAMAEAILSFAR